MTLQKQFYDNIPLYKSIKMFGQQDFHYINEVVLPYQYQSVTSSLNHLPHSYTGNCCLFRFNFFFQK
jgi:hypothetical protein